MKLPTGYYTTDGSGVIRFAGAEPPSCATAVCVTSFVSWAKLPINIGLHYSYFDHGSIGLLYEFVEAGRGTVFTIEQGI